MLDGYGPVHEALASCSPRSGIVSRLGWQEGTACHCRKNCIIRTIREAAHSEGEGDLGIGDDCAVIRIPRGHEALITTDFSLEDVHFRKAWHPPDSVGHRCLARGLSDIAAMGGMPTAAFLVAGTSALISRKDGSIGLFGDCLGWRTAIRCFWQAEIRRSRRTAFWPTSSYLARFRRARRCCGRARAPATCST